MNALGLPSIRSVRGFVQPGDNMSWMFKLAGKTRWAQEDAFIETADRELQLNGELISHSREHGIKWEPVPPGTHTNSADFLRQHSETMLFQAWSEITQSGTRYTVLVDYRDHSDAVLGDEALKAEVFKYWQREMARHLFADNESGDIMDHISRIAAAITYRFGIPYNRMGFFFDHIKSVTCQQPPAHDK
jgi:hypothetical protein